MAKIIDQKEVALNYDVIAGLSFCVFVPILLACLGVFAGVEIPTFLIIITGIPLAFLTAGVGTALIILPLSLMTGETTLNSISSGVFNFFYKEVKQPDECVTTYRKLTKYNPHEGP